MIRSSFTGAALGLALIAGVAGTADAQAVAPTPPSDTADLQCFGVFMYLGGQGQDAAAKAWFTGQAQYYLGGLQGRSPDVDWLDRLTAYFSGPFPQEFEAQRPRCATEAEARDAALQGWSVAFMEKVAAARNGD